MVQEEHGDEVVTVLPITHTPPVDPADAFEIPYATKRRLRLDEELSWVVVTESNRFRWPGPDLRMIRTNDAASVSYGILPGTFFEQVRLAFLGKVRAARAAIIGTRTK